MNDILWGHRSMDKLREIILPAQYPEQIIFERRDDGFYDMTTKVYAVDPDDKSKTKIAYQKCVVTLPKWYYGIPVTAVQQDNNILWTIEFPEKEVDE